MSSDPTRAVELMAKRPRKRRRSFKSVLRRDPCAYCGTDLEMTVDHIVPKAHGGKNCTDNLTAACRLCNARKADMGLLDFLWYRTGT